MLIASSMLLAGCGGAPEEAVVVFAAASLRDVLLEVAALSDQEVVFNFAGSNVLAQQLTAAPDRADVYLSASTDWMDDIEQRGLIAEDSRREFLSNQLQVITNIDSTLSLSSIDELADVELRYLAIADPAAVPAGIYAQQALDDIPLDAGSLWEHLQDRVVPAPDVRAALALVEQQQGIVGIVYRTDALQSERIRVLCPVPAEHTPVIRYSVAQLEQARAPQKGQAFLELLTSPAAIAIFEAHGFVMAEVR